MASKLPAFALVVVFEDGRIENAEFVADFFDGDDGVIGELWRWKRDNLPRIPGTTPFTCWLKAGKSFGHGRWQMVDVNSPTPTKGLRRQ